MRGRWHLYSLRASACVSAWRVCEHVEQCRYSHSLIIASTLSAQPPSCAGKTCKLLSLADYTMECQGPPNRKVTRTRTVSIEDEVQCVTKTTTVEVKRKQDAAVHAKTSALPIFMPTPAHSQLH
jgi:hypothetical protein